MFRAPKIYPSSFALRTFVVGFPLFVFCIFNFRCCSNAIRHAPNLACPLLFRGMFRRLCLGLRGRHVNSHAYVFALANSACGVGESSIVTVILSSAVGLFGLFKGWDYGRGFVCSFPRRCDTFVSNLHPTCSALLSRSTQIAV